MSDPAPAATKIEAETLVRVYDVLLDGTDIGYVDEPECTIDKILKEKKLSQLFGQVMGHRLLGVSAKIKMNVRQITAAKVALNFPWYSGTGSIPIMPPALGGDLYDYAKSLTLHPRDALTDKTQDITLVKAVCTGSLKLKGDGDNEGIIPLEFSAYPDRTKLPALMLGYIGDTEPTTTPA
jgi:hypothetical protein